MARKIGISVPYLSQMETGERPLTAPVLLALTRAFPAQWTMGDPEDAAILLAETLEAAADPSVPAARLTAGEAERGLRQQPLMAQRMVALHAAFRRSQEQLRILDDQVEAGAGEPHRLPWEAVRDWFHAESNYIDRLDREAETIAGQLPDGDPATVLREQLWRRFGVSVVSLADHEGRLRSFDPAARELRVDRSQPPETTLFALAHQYVRLQFADSIAGIVEQSGIAPDAGRQLLAAGLANYAAGALLMPYSRFRAAARVCRHDIDRLRQNFGTSFEQTCHRLSTLQRPGAPGIPFFFCRVDMAGNITKRHSATRLQFARFGGACPLWIMHEAVAIPDRILVQHAETPDGIRYMIMAKGLVKPSGSYRRPPRRYAVALGCEESHARQFIYADSLGIGGTATPIGSSCRICPRADCDQRAFPPAASEIHIEPNVRTAVPYNFR